MQTKQGKQSMIPFVSVVIPVFNDPEGLARCLEALSRQTYPAERYEIVVVDNNSKEPAEKVAMLFRNVKVVTEARQGLHAARNKGISSARGDVFAFTDADCIPEKTWIEEGVKVFLTAESCGLVGGKVDVFARDAAHPAAAELFEQLFAFRQEEYIARHHFAVTANVFTSRKVIERVGMLDGSLLSAGDMEWGQRVYAAGYGIVYAPLAVVKHPARPTLSALLKKHRRVKGGFYDMRIKKGPYPIKDFLIDLKDDWPQMVQTERVFQEKRLSFFTKAIIVGILFLVRASRLVEMIRLRCGGRSGW